VYELLAGKDALPRDKKRGFFHFSEGLRLYRDRRFAEALDEFNRVAHTFPEDGPTGVYVERCRRFAADPPPPDWDGVFVMTSK
jgi:hypothetical protein